MSSCRNTFCVSEADETNVNRLWELSANRRNHLHNLQNIYRQRNQVRTRSQKDHFRRKKQLEQYQKLKQTNHYFRHKSIQQKINYENAILRNKLIGIMDNKKKSHSFSMNRSNPYKTLKQEEMYRTNKQLGLRLSNMKSQVGKNNIQQHSRMTQQYMEMIQKKSPKRKAYLKSLTRKKVVSSKFLPEIDDSLYSIY